MPVFSIQLEFDESGAVKAVRNLNNISEAARNAQKAGTGFANEISKGTLDATKKVFGLISAYKALENAMSFLNRGISLGASMEQSQIGIATLISSMAKLEDAQGRALEGAEKYAAAQQVSAELMKEIKRLGLETTADTQSLVEGVQSIKMPRKAPQHGPFLLLAECTAIGQCLHDCMIAECW